jgi:hypothetical protein
MSDFCPPETWPLVAAHFTESIVFPALAFGLGALPFLRGARIQES